jgi:hypothetical protein
MKVQIVDYTQPNVIYLRLGGQDLDTCRWELEEYMTVFGSYPDMLVISRRQYVNLLGATPREIEFHPEVYRIFGFPFIIEGPRNYELKDNRII